MLIRKSVEKKQGKREWHILFRGRYEGLYIKPKLIFRQTGDRIIATVDRNVGYYCINSVHIGLVKREHYNKFDYFIGLLNSKLIDFYYQEISQEKGRVLAEVKPQRIKALPIAWATDIEQQTIENLVNRIKATKQTNPQADTSVWEAEIDRLIYALYGLTEAEITIVEEP